VPSTTPRRSRRSVGIALFGSTRGLNSPLGQFHFVSTRAASYSQIGLSQPAIFFPGRATRCTTFLPMLSQRASTVSDPHPRNFTSSAGLTHCSCFTAFATTATLRRHDIESSNVFLCRHETSTPAMQLTAARLTFTLSMIKTLHCNSAALSVAAAGLVLVR
jgi:hypothetical protein